MKKVLLLFSTLLLLFSCDDPEPCTDGIQNGTETDIDCGGDCGPCPNCLDGIQNFQETGVDCGGNCEPCPDEAGIINYPGSGRQEHVFFVNEQVGYLMNNLFPNYTIMRTRDGGDNWESFTTSLSGVNTGNQSVTEFEFINENQGYAIERTDNGISDFSVFVTTDSGETWDATFTTISKAIFDVDFASSNIGYLITPSLENAYSCEVHKSNDGGTTWNKIYEVPLDPNYPYSPNSISFINEDHGFMTSIFNTYETTDGGVTWTKKSNTLLESQQRSLYMITDKVGYMYGYHADLFQDLYKTDDGGASWTSTDFSKNPNLSSNYTIVPYLKDESTAYMAFSLSDYDQYAMLKTDNNGTTWKQYGSIPFIDGQQRGFLHRCAPALDGSAMYCIEYDRGLLLKLDLQ